MFKNILLHLGSEIDGPMIKHSLTFAEKCGAKLTVLNVFAAPRPSVVDYFSGEGKDLKKIITNGHEAQLHSELEKEGIAVDNINHTLRWGKDFIECIRAVNEDKYDLVICPPAGNSKIPDSIALHLLRKCPCPVWVNHGHLWRGAIRILAAIGPFDNSESNRQFNRSILNHAAWLSRILGGKLHVMHCWKGYMEGMTDSPFFSETEVDKYLDFEKNSSEDEFNMLLDAVEFKEEPRRVLMHGDPGTLIPQYAVEKMMDIVVMGSVARSGIAGLLIGNTAEKITTSLDESLLAIKPAGFVSPVR